MRWGKESDLVGDSECVGICETPGGPAEEVEGSWRVKIRESCGERRCGLCTPRNIAEAVGVDEITCSTRKEVVSDKRGPGRKLGEFQHSKEREEIRDRRGSLSGKGGEKERVGREKGNNRRKCP